MSIVASRLVAGAGGLGIATYLMLSASASAVVYPLFSAGIVLATLWCVGTGRIVAGRGAWLLFALANALWFVGDVTFSALTLLSPEQRAAFPSVADAIYLAAYPVLAVAIGWASRLRGPRRDTVASLDGFMVAVAAAVPIWVLWVGPALRDGSPTGLNLVVTLLYPAMDLVLIGVGTRFVLGGGRWTTATVVGITGLGITIISDIAYNVASILGTYQAPDPLDLGFLLANLLWIVMTLHPSAATMLEGGHRVQGVSYRARTWALVAIVLLPLSVLAVSYVQGDPVQGQVVIGAFVVICAAMTLRLRLVARTGSTAWRGPALLSAAALVVVVTATSLTNLQQESMQSQAIADRLTEATAVAERLDGIAVRTDRPGPDGQQARRLWTIQIANLRERLATAGPALTAADRHELLGLLAKYERALGRELRVADTGDIGLASALEREQITPAHQAFIARTHEVAGAYRARSRSAAYRSRLSTVIALALSLSLLTLLLVRFGGVGRRQQLAHQALHDALTGLPNRALIEERLRKAFSRPRRELTLQGFVMLDLDDFKAVNDSLGHPIGDELLRAVGQRLAASAREGDVLARIGGDGFAILLSDIPDADAAIATARCMLSQLETPFEIAGTTHLAHGSVGIAVSDGITADNGFSAGTPAERAATMLRDAELAMYAAKEHEGNSFELFIADMHDAVAKRLELKAELAQAIRCEQFTLAYQPIVDIAARKVVGYEALLRWIHPERGFVSPAEFIPVAEQTGLIVELGTWVLREACRQTALWRKEWADDRYISVNVAGHQLQREDFAEHVASALADTGLPASALLLEVTESSLILDVEGSQRRMDAVRELGVRFAIDDFGTGYSSLSYLSKFPLDVLKVDKSFIDEITTGARGRAIVDAIVNMAGSLDLSVVAEGIEEPEQMQVLAEIGCGLGQGYYYARPLPPVDVPGFEIEPDLRVVRTA